MKQIIRVFVHEEDAIDMPTDPVGVMQFWSEIVSCMPDGALNPYIDLDVEYDIDRWKVVLTVRYEREETEDEEIARKAEAARRVVDIEVRERAILQQLKDKYE